jgi:SecD/SecF fusion protein
MQSKGAIKFLAILLAVICLFQLSFTLVTSHVEKKALEAGNGDPVKYKAYLDSVSPLTAYNLGIVKYTYQDCKEREINLGLDLKGGMNVTMEVSVVDIIRNMSSNPADVTLNKAIDLAAVMEQSSQEDFVTLFGKAFTKVDPNAHLAALYSTMDLQNKVTFNSTNDEVLKIIRKEADDAITRTYNILRTRIDKFGVTQPNIQQLGAGRILIELPGVKEPERVRKLLQGTAKLEFWETYDNSEAFPFLENVNKALKNKGTKDSLMKTLNGDTTKLASDDTTAKTGKDSAALAANDTGANKKPSLLEKIENVKDSGKSSKDTSQEAQFSKFSKENPLFVVLTPAFYNDPQSNQQKYRKGPAVGYSAIKDTGKVNAILSRPDIKAILPRDIRFLWTAKPPTKESKFLELIAIKVKSRDGSPPLDGAAISDAGWDRSQFTSNYEINMRMNAEGAKIWKRLTGENVNKAIAISLDDYIYSYPNVLGEISGGSSSITGNFSLLEAQDLSNILKAGKLPAPAHIVSEAVVGPSLGQEAISHGLLSFLIALVLVLIFMALYYNKAGRVADVALFCNMFFIMGVLASVQAVLTLPGIAGIVLTIGMSVDANILIFERVREELHNGKGIRLAVSDGFKHAYSSIIDSNITTLLLGIILFIFGTGPIQGFASTLIIGILTSLFCAIFITRLIFEWLLEKNATIPFSNRFTKDAFKNIHIDFVGKRKWYYIISSVVILAGLVSLMTKGFNFGVDFKGGRSYVVQFDQTVTSDQARQELAAPFGAAPEVKTFGTDNRLKITTTYLIGDNSQDAEVKVTDALYNGLKTHFPNTTIDAFKKSHIINSVKVGATIADDIKVSAVWAILFGCLVMFLYIWVRFKKWQYGLGATVALFHDALVVMSFYTILNGVVPFTLEVDQAFIAAVLTIMGYSMTDTVVVFDRIREFLGIHHTAADMKPVINNALNATLSRTINTSLTIFFTLLAIFIFGGDVIRGFSFALLIGIVVGTYSSICIATPIIIDFAREKK